MLIFFCNFANRMENYKIKYKMKVLVLNCGSSSIKYQLMDMTKENGVIAKGLVEKIGLPLGIFTQKASGRDNYSVETPISDHKRGIALIIEALTDKNHGVIANVDEIKAVGHRVAHGGEYFKSSVLVDADAKAKIKELFELAPLHNPANYSGIEAMEALLPTVPQVAVFDTSFHQTMPEVAYIYGIPYEYYTENKVRRYGFHGTSHKFVAEKACNEIGIDIAKSKIITCHLGNGASITAIENGRSVDTSMGFTPVEGLVMGTRCGNVDLGALLYIMDKENMTTQDANNLINKRSGMQGVSGVSSDMRDLGKAASEDNNRAKLALDLFAYNVIKYIGAYAAVMNGVDLIIFTGGIGENDFEARANICANLGYLGVDFDTEVNKGLRGQDTVLTKANSKVKVMLVTTDEELVIATDTYRLVK